MVGSCLSSQLCCHLWHHWSVFNLDVGYVELVSARRRSYTVVLECEIHLAAILNLHHTSVDCVAVILHIFHIAELLEACSRSFGVFHRTHLERCALAVVAINYAIVTSLDVKWRCHQVVVAHGIFSHLGVVVACRAAAVRTVVISPCVAVVVGVNHSVEAPPVFVVELELVWQRLCVVAHPTGSHCLGCSCGSATVVVGHHLIVVISWSRHSVNIVHGSTHLRSVKCLNHFTAAQHLNLSECSEVGVDVCLFGVGPSEGHVVFHVVKRHCSKVSNLLWHD